MNKIDIKWMKNIFNFFALKDEIKKINSHINNLKFYQGKEMSKRSLRIKKDNEYLPILQQNANGLKTQEVKTVLLK